MTDLQAELHQLEDKVTECKDNYGYLVPDLFPSKPLYRYRSNIKHAIEEIQNSYIYLSSIDSLNDPFDSSFIIPFEKAKEETHPGKYYFEKCTFINRAKWYSSIENEMKTSGVYTKSITMQDFFSYLEKKVKEHGLNYSAQFMMELFYESNYNSIHHSYGYSASFSERNDSILMWSYYADSHKGICLGYDVNRLDSSIEEQKVLLSSLKKVWYSSERYDDSKSKYTPFVKAQGWAHEQEWRLFHKTNKGKIKFPCLQSVYLGMNFEIESESFYHVIEAIKSNPLDISLYKCSPDMLTYKINQIQILI